MSLQRCGIDAVSAALDTMQDGGDTVELVLAQKEVSDDQLNALLSRCEEMGVEITYGSDSDLWRMAIGTAPGSTPPLALALVGRDPTGDLSQVLSRGGLVWMLAGAQYSSNVGYCIRMAEVSGADAILVAGDWSNSDRHQAVRAAMRTHRFLPVIWCGSPLDAVAQAKQAGMSVAGIEDVGDVEPWDSDLTGDLLLIIGGESEGIPTEVLDECDSVIRIPMAGFTPSYNLQAPMAIVAVEALRQRRDE